MNRQDIIRMAQQAGFNPVSYMGANLESFERFASLVAAAERKMLMQLFTDPENQPTQHGTVTMEYMQQEIAAEREACAMVAEQWPYEDERMFSIAQAIRTRGEQ